MEEVNIITEFLSKTTILCYVLGMVTFLFSSLDEIDRWITKNEQKLSVLMIIQIIGLTLIALTLSIIICDIIADSWYVNVVFAMITGLFGGYFIRFFDSNKDKIFSRTINKIINKFINMIFSFFKKDSSSDYEYTDSDSNITYEDITSSDIENICNKTHNDDNFIDKDSKLENYEHIKDKEEYNKNNVFIDKEQSTYNPFE